MGGGEGLKRRSVRRRRRRRVCYERNTESKRL